MAGHESPAAVVCGANASKLRGILTILQDCRLDRDTPSTNLHSPPQLLPPCATVEAAKRVGDWGRHGVPRCSVAIDRDFGPPATGPDPLILRQEQVAMNGEATWLRQPGWSAEFAAGKSRHEWRRYVAVATGSANRWPDTIAEFRRPKVAANRQLKVEAIGSQSLQRVHPHQRSRPCAQDC